MDIVASIAAIAADIGPKAAPIIARSIGTSVAGLADSFTGMRIGRTERSARKATASGRAVISAISRGLSSRAASRLPSIARAARSGAAVASVAVAVAVAAAGAAERPSQKKRAAGLATSRPSSFHPIMLQLREGSSSLAARSSCSSTGMPE